MRLFYNTVTTDIVDYNGLKALFPGVIWHVNENNASVDEYIENTQPPNPYLHLYPTLANWEPLTRIIEPTGYEMWKIARLDAPAYNVGNSRWEQDWVIDNRTTGEMVEVNIAIADFAKNYKDEKLGTVLNHNDLYFNCTRETLSAIAALIDYLKNDGTGLTINWKGEHDENFLPRWAVADMEDLQEMSVLNTAHQQKAFETEQAILAQQLITPFDQLVDAFVFANDYYDNL